MPPKPKINKEEIIKCSMLLLREKGIESINARSIAKELNCSTKPLFTVFNNMKEIKDALFVHADAYMSHYMLNYKTKYHHKLLDIGLAYVHFANEEKNIFRWIYLTDQLSSSSFDEFIFSGDGETIYKRFLDAFGREKQTDFEKKTYLQLFIYVYGIAVLTATNSILFSDEILVEMLSNMYRKLTKDE